MTAVVVNWDLSNSNGIDSTQFNTTTILKLYNFTFYKRNHLNKEVFIFHFNDGGILSKSFRGNLWNHQEKFWCHSQRLNPSPSACEVGAIAIIYNDDKKETHKKKLLSFLFKNTFYYPMFRNINIVDHDLLFLYILNSFVDFVFPFFPCIEFKSVEYLNSFCITTLLYWPPRPWVLSKTWTNTKRIITNVLIQLFSNTTGMPKFFRSPCRCCLEHC